jgi:RNA polymerase sigma-70 factor (ECF subfamily)
VITLSTLWAAPAGLRSEEEPARGLLARATHGEAAALQQMYRLHAPAIRRFLRGVLRCAASADDGTQETFVRAFRQLGTLRDESRLVPFLFGIARLVAREMHRTNRRITSGAIPTQPDNYTPESALLGAEVARTLDTALDELSEGRRAALLLRVDHGLPYEEIAEIMGWSLAKAKVEVHRAREVLRRHLAGHEETTK